MKINMAEGEPFAIGMIVSCTTCTGQKIQGEVIAFDQAHKMLALKSAAGSGKPNKHDVRLINTEYLSDFSMVRDATDSPPALTSLNIGKINQRLRSNLDDKKRQVAYIGQNVTPQAQNLFLYITKTISEVRWDGQNIIVMDNVHIVPPYNVDNCTSKETNSTCLTHVKKIMEKYFVDQARESSPSSTSSS